MADEMPKKKETPETKEPEPKKQDRLEDIYQLASSNLKDTLAYVAMIIGILMLFFEPFYGGAIIGIIAGLYFTKEIITPLKSIESFIEKQGMVRSLILGGLLLGIFIEAPAIIIGMAVAVGLKQIILPENDEKKAP